MEAFPLMQEQQVVVDASDLNLDEKRQIIYNHLKYGNQPAEFRSAVKPYLESVATSQGFLPITAMRLGNRAYTRRLHPSAGSIRHFVTQPVEYLLDVIRSLDDSSQQALAALFASGGRLHSPIVMDSGRMDIFELVSISPTACGRALENMEGTFVKIDLDDERRTWVFAHPTIRDAMARFLGESPELLHVYIRGAPIPALTREVVCSGVERPGATISVTADHFATLIDRFKTAIEIRNGLVFSDQYGAILDFLVDRSSARFLEMVIYEYPQLLEKLHDWGPFVEASKEARCLARLKNENLLSEVDNSRFVQQLTEQAIEFGDLGFLTESWLKESLTQSEIYSIIRALEEEINVDGEGLLENWIDGAREASKPEFVISSLQGLIGGLEMVAAEPVESNTQDWLSEAREEIEYELNQWNDPRDHDEYEGHGDTASGRPTDSGERSVFDDVDS